MRGSFSACTFFNNSLVLKKYTEQGISFGHLDNEVKWYRKFNKIKGVRYVPRMLDYTKDSLILEYVGEPLALGMKIHEFKQQLLDIALFLESQKCQHCDINPNNLLVSDPRVFIIDFGWTVKRGQDPYYRWRHVDKKIINCIGAAYRAPNWPNDRFALNKVYWEYSDDPNEELFP